MGLDQGEVGQRRGVKGAPAGLAVELVNPPRGQARIGLVVAAAVGQAHRRREQTRQLRPFSAGAERCIADRQTEKAGEAERLYRLGLVFQMTPEHLRANIDAKRRLNLGGRRPGRGRRRDQARGEILLVVNFVRALPEVMQRQRMGVGRRLASLPGLLPLRPGRVRAALGVIEQAFPTQPYGQQLDQAVIIAARQAGLPALVGAPGRPAVDAQQHRL